MEQQTTEDPIDFKALPKIELHAHLSGSISRQCLHEVWLKKRAAGEIPDLADPLEAMPPGKHDFDLTTFFPLFSSYTYRLINDAWSVTYTTLSVLEDFAADGVVYLELRTTPRSTSTFTPTAYVQTVLSAISQFSATNKTMHTRLILSIDRRHSLATAHQTLLLARKFSDSGVVGLDLCGDPSHLSIAHLAPVFLEARATLPSLGLTLHFAETEGCGTEEELGMLLSWKPDRIGHVIYVPARIRNDIIARRGMGLELCLSCNVHAGMICGGFESHHFGEWWKVEGCNVVLSTDDVGVFGSPLSNEYALVAQHFGLGRAEICALARKGIDVIFGGDQEKARLREIMWTACS